MKQHHCYKLASKPTDYLCGVSSPIPFKSVMPSGDWTSHNEYFERQSFGNFDTEGCVIFACQESIDAQIDELISIGSIPSSLLTLFNQLGFMDTASLDGKAHFHSSPRFLQSLTGNGFTGNALTDPADAARKFGIIPWTSLPFDATITQAEYLLTPMPQNLLNIGQQFLAAVGGKGWLGYQWVVKQLPTNTPAMDKARQQSPLCLAVLAEAPDWNQYEPPIPVGPPCHGVQNYSKNAIGELVLDHYSPFCKVLQTGYPIPQVLQVVVNIHPPPPAPTLPTNPTVPQEKNWLSQLMIWLQNILNSMKGRLTSNKYMTKLQAVNLSPVAQSLLDIGIKVGVGAVILLLDYVTTALSNGSVTLPYPQLSIPLLTLLVSQLDSFVVEYAKKEDIPVPTV